jgi:hypothetical protein
VIRQHPTRRAYLSALRAFRRRYETYADDKPPERQRWARGWARLIQALCDHSERVVVEWDERTWDAMSYRHPWSHWLALFEEIEGRKQQSWKDMALHAKKIIDGHVDLRPLEIILDDHLPDNVVRLDEFREDEQGVG